MLDGAAFAWQGQSERHRCADCQSGDLVLWHRSARLGELGEDGAPLIVHGYDHVSSFARPRDRQDCLDRPGQRSLRLAPDCPRQCRKKWLHCWVQPVCTAVRTLRSVSSTRLFAGRPAAPRLELAPGRTVPSQP